jgi:hypothetical protein
MQENHRTHVKPQPLLHSLGDQNEQQDFQNLSIIQTPEYALVLLGQGQSNTPNNQVHHFE